MDDTPLKASIRLNAAGGALTLRDKQLLHMRDARGWSVKAVTGSIWITQESDSRDIVLDEGETFVLDREGSVLVTAFGDSIVCLEHNGTEEIETTSHTVPKLSSLLSLTSALFSKV
jgi:hypothetical protein